MKTKFKLMAPFGAAFLVACAHEREFRVAYVGSEGSVEIGGDEGGNSATPPIVAAGNAPLGPVGSAVAGGATGQRGIVNGSVTSVLPSTNQTLVQLSDGATVLINGTGGALGDLVAIDLGAGRVVGGATSLLGTSVMNRSAPVGQLTGSTLGNAGKLVNLPSGAGASAVTSVTAPVRSATGGVTNILTKPLGGGCC